MNRKLIAVLIAAALAAPVAAYAQSTPAPKDTGMSQSTPSASATVKSDASVKTSKSSPDSIITGKIKSGFIKDKIVRSRSYNVDTRDGVVTVKGKARSQAEADRALEIAKSTEGVKSVNNEVRVVASTSASSSKKKSSTTASAKDVEPRNSTPTSEQPKDKTASTSSKRSSSTGTSTSASSSNSSPDALITTKVKAEYAKDKVVSATKIHVDTDHGVVHLSGMAKSQEEADKAVALAKNVKGVSSVKSDIKVEGK